MPDQPDFKYFAFISYSHRDKKWGDWLHKALETYKVPKRLHGHAPDGQALPKRLFPVFRDREELPTSASLGAQITDALARSRFLIIICSPHAAQSVWVNEEIKTFKAMGRGDRILSLIVDGEPNAADKPEGEAAECFPPALRFRLDAAGNPGEERSEPIAADARPGKDGKKNALLKLVAGLLGVSFDDLKQREQERRVRRLMAAGAVMAVLMALFAGLAWRAWVSARKAVASEQAAKQNEQVAKKNEQVARSRLAELYLREGSKASDAHDWSMALHWYARSLHEEETLAAKFAAADALSNNVFELATLRGHEDTVDTLAVTPDGKILASASWDETIRLWTLADGKTFDVIPADKRSKLSFSRDGTRLGYYGGDGFSQFIEMPNGSTSARVTSQLDDVTFLANSSEHNIFTVQYNDGVIKAYKPDDRSQQTITKLAHTLHAISPVNGLGISSGPNFGTFLLLNYKTQKKPQAFTLERERWWTHAAFRDDGKMLAVGDRSGTISLWDLPVKEPAEPCKLTGHTGEISDLAFSNDNALLASSSWDNTIRLWGKLKQCGEEKAVLRGHPTRAYSVAIASDGKTVFSGGWDHTIRLWDTGNGWGKHVLQGHKGAILAIAFSPDSNTIATGSRDRTLRIWNRDSGNTLAVLQGHSDFVTSVVFSKDGQSVVSGSQDGTVRCWSLAPDTSPIVLPPRSGAIIALAFSPDGKRLLAGTKDGNVVAWDWQTKAATVLPLHMGQVSAVAFSPDGRQIVSAGQDSQICLWDLDTGEKRATLLDAVHTINSVAFSPDGMVFACIGFDAEDSKVLVFDPSKAQKLPSLRTNDSAPKTLSFSKSNHFIASSGGDTGIDFWDRNTSRRVAKFVHDSYVNLNSLVTFSPDEESIALAASNKLILWTTGDTSALLNKITTANSIGSSYDAGDNGQLVPKDAVALAQTRLEAAKAGRIWWREDGGRSLVPLYENELQQAQAAASAPTN